MDTNVDLFKQIDVSDDISLSKVRTRAYLYMLVIPLAD